MFLFSYIVSQWNELVGVKVGASVVSGRNPLKDQLTFVAGPSSLWQWPHLKPEHNEEVTLGNVFSSLTVFCQFTQNNHRQMTSIAIITACHRWVAAAGEVSIRARHPECISWELLLHLDLPHSQCCTQCVPV